MTKDEAYQKWLDGLTYGATVAVENRGGMSAGVHLTRITKITKVGGGRIHTADNRVFKKRNGDEVGEGFWKSKLRAPTDEVREQITHRRLWGILSDFFDNRENINRISTAALKEIHERLSNDHVFGSSAPEED